MRYSIQLKVVQIVVASIILLFFNSHAVFAKPKKVTVSCMKPLGHHLAYRHYICPLGGEKFKSLALGTHSTFGRYFDLKPVSYMNFPPPVPVCPSNGFVMYKAKFKKEEMRKLKKIILSKEYKALLGKNTSYFLFARVMEKMPNSQKLAKWLYLRASWEAQDCNSDLYKQYATLAIARFDAAIKAEKPEAKETKFWSYNILVSNFYRRLGEFNKAEQRIDLLLNKYPKVMPKIIRESVLQLKENIAKKESKPLKVGRKKKPGTTTLYTK